MAKINVITPNNLGKGIKHNPQSKKWEVNVDNSTITVNPQGQLVAQGSGGLDCAAIAALPKTAWKPNTSILVNQDGTCKRLVPNENIFTDVVVDLAASKQNVEIPKNQSETVNIIATVTNAGSNPTGEVLVTLTKPQLGTYQLGTPTTNNIGETKTGELTWKVPAMASGKSLVITLPVTFSKVGSFSFGLQATSTIDTNTQNNNKTMTFTVTERIVNDGTNTNYVPPVGKDCPLIIATDLTHNKRLNVMSMPSYQLGKEFFEYVNIFADGRGFAGKQIKLKGASTVMVTSAIVESAFNGTSYYEIAEDTASGAYGSATATSKYNQGSSSYSPSLGLAVGSIYVNYGYHEFSEWSTEQSILSPENLRNMGTFDPQTQIFTFNSNLQLPTRTTSFNEAPYHCVIWCRPTGKDCKWQGIPIVLGIKDKLTKAAPRITNHYGVNVLKGNVNVDKTTSQLTSIHPHNVLNSSNFVGASNPNDFITVDYGLVKYETKGDSTYVDTKRINVTSGVEAKFTIHDYVNKKRYNSTGKVSMTYDDSTKLATVTVAANATSADSIYWNDLQIIVK